ncbi:AAA family ATPase [Saccharopolyspora sp. NFXS83]|uniref:AAA family ATPase n=1 Tax=Saccharopolyspora sp. NFXS83 TaxID=2993560 RepID=UPI00224B009E|nr:ATP-binding protein [Saccharopolyspora sp. NFXS83]MCX2729548.1 AAA family ATPase [Saccharopolyspora sp. NFXS83]
MSPLAVFVSGAPASGKTTLAGALAERLGAALLDLDVVTGPLTSLLGEVSGAGAALDHPWMREHARGARYESLLATALDSVRVGTSAVLVAPFTAERADPASWTAATERFRAAGADPVLVWMDSPPEVILSRMRGRAAERDADKLADPAKVLAARAAPPITPHVRVDATRPTAEQLAELDRSGLSGRKPACLEATSRSTTWPPRPG